MGIVIALILTLAPLWIVYDGVMQKVTLFNFFTAAELTLKRKWIAIPAIILVLMNWLWNIHKGL